MSDEQASYHHETADNSLGDVARHARGRLTRKSSGKYCQPGSQPGQLVSCGRKRRRRQIGIPGCSSLRIGCARIWPEVDHVPGNAGADGLRRLCEQLHGCLVDRVAWGDLREVALRRRGRVRGGGRGQETRRDREHIRPDCDLLTGLAKGKHGCISQQRIEGRSSYLRVVYSDRVAWVVGGITVHAGSREVHRGIGFDWQRVVVRPLVDEVSCDQRRDSLTTTTQARSPMTASTMSASLPAATGSTSCHPKR